VTALDAPATLLVDAPRRAAHRRRLAEVAFVAALLILLECLVFWGYFSGAYAPPWDFMGSYNTDAYAWWTEGSFFHPAEWISHAWGGYPAAASIQNSAWYLPVGLTALVTPFTIHASAALAALHYGFGALGVYALGRAFRLGRIPSTFGLVAFFFVSGFYAQAEHVDIARGYAWLPWILLCTSHRWPWRRWWSVPVAALILWQALLGTYPGIIVASVYCVAVWVIVQQISSRTPIRRYLLPLAASGAITLLLLAPKYVPVVLLDAGGAAANPDVSLVSWSVVATMFLPYGNPSIPSDIALRSFFLPATCFVLAGLASLRSSLGRAALAVLAVAMLLGLPSTPWHGAVDLLPGLTLSRFRMSDFRSFMLLSVCLLAMTALARLLERTAGQRASQGRREIASRMWLVLLTPAVLTLALANGFSTSEWAVPVIIVAAACAVVWLCVMPLPVGLADFRINRRPAALALLALTLTSGVTGAFATSAPWLSPREASETVSFGSPVDSLVAQDASTGAEQRRPARTPVTQPKTPADLISTQWNASFYRDTDSVGGLVNLKRSESFNELQAALLDPGQFDLANDLYSAPGVVVELTDGSLPSIDELETCVSTGECGNDLTVAPERYEPGHLKYTVTASRDVTVALNEAYYLGWRAVACRAPAGTCQELQAVRGPIGTLSLRVPAGHWNLALDYVPPASHKAWAAFWAGAVALALSACGSAAAGVWSRLRRSRSSVQSPVPLPATDQMRT